MTPVIHIDKDPAVPSPDDDSFYCWVSATLNHLKQPLPAHPEVSFRINDVKEMAELNARFRAKAGPTNVLSFPADLATEQTASLLGDIAICSPIVLAEAGEQGKSEQSHWAHLTVHGVLHLLGYDHITPADAQTMESLEIAILGGLGFNDPYQLSNLREPSP